MNRVMPLLFFCALIAVWLNVIVILMMLNPHRQHLHCVQWVQGPTPVYACSDGHGYALEHGRMIDLGRASSTPYLPGR